MSYLFKSEIVEPFGAVPVFTKEQCEEIIKIGIAAGLSDSLVRDADSKAVIDNNWRISRTSWIEPTNQNRGIYSMLSAAAISINDNSYQFDLYGFAEHLQFAQYTAPGGKYDPHIDCIHNGLIRKLSVSVQLSDEDSYEGGNLCINYGKDIMMPRTQGMAIVFPSPAVHSVQPVTKGTRHSLVGWITGPRFK